jgi:4-diphosphocytidyl-2-C-methyl-D-erythritol kinase
VTRVIAPAKLTVSLAVTGVRPDGLHELRAEMVALSLADELTITEGGTGLTVTAEPGARAGTLGGDEGNLIVRALAAVRRTAAVHLVKRIPLGGGLGGGSSDAAAVLRWAGCTDAATALELGSDVPFSLAGGCALVEGVGDVVTPLEYVRREFVLLIPPFGVHTGRVYAAWDERRRSRSSDGGANELTDAALFVEPRLRMWRDALGELTGRTPVLAGSGSTWFVEAGPGEIATDDLHWLDVGAARARLVRVHTVPDGWDGD